MSPKKVFIGICACALVLGTATFASSSHVGQTPRASVMGSATAPGGVVLDGFGGLTPFGGVSLNTAGAPYWSGWNIARSVVVLPDGSGGWTLDGWGGISNWGSAPHVVSNSYWYGWDIARGLSIHYNSAGVPDGGWTLDGWGGITSWGAAPSISTEYYTPGWDASMKLHVSGNSGYQVFRYGDVEEVGSPLGISWAGYPSWGSWDIVRDVFPMNPSLAAASNSPVNRAEAGALMDSLQSNDRISRGAAPIWTDNTLLNIAGDGAGYNLAGCGGPNLAIADRTADMYQRNYFAHPISGCAGTEYVFQTYMPAYGESYSRAGENIAWREGDRSLITDISQINTMWLNSPEHYANIMGQYSFIGCGVYDNPAGVYQGASGPVWVWACDFRG